MNERELLERIKAKVIDLARTTTIQQVLLGKMADKLVELIGEEAFDEWGDPIVEEAEQAAKAVVEQLEAEAKDMRAMSEGVHAS